MRNLLNALIDQLVTACVNALTVINNTKTGNLIADVEGQVVFELDLGWLGATSFDGLWGAANMPAQELLLSFVVEKDYISDGRICVKTDAQSLVYGSDIELVIEDMIKQASNGLISGTGSEQGMQGDFEVDDNGMYTHAYSIDVHVDSPEFEQLQELVYA